MEKSKEQWGGRKKSVCRPGEGEGGGAYGGILLSSSDELEKEQMSNRGERWKDGEAGVEERMKESKNQVLQIKTSIQMCHSSLCFSCVCDTSRCRVSYLWKPPDVKSGNPKQNGESGPPVTPSSVGPRWLWLTCSCCRHTS